MSEFVKLAFYSGKGDNVLLAWMIKNLTGDHTHVEILFQEGLDSENFITSSIEQGRYVYWKRKTFGRKNWEYITVSGLTKNQVQNMRNFCYKESQNNKFFNENGMFRSITPLPKKNYDQKKWFCSEYVTTALQQGGLLENLNPSATTPTSLYNNILKQIPAKHLNKSSNPWYKRRINRTNFVKL